MSALTRIALCVLLIPSLEVAAATASKPVKAMAKHIICKGGGVHVDLVKTKQCPDGRRHVVMSPDAPEKTQAFEAVKIVRLGCYSDAEVQRLLTPVGGDPLDAALTRAAQLNYGKLKRTYPSTGVFSSPDEIPMKCRYAQA